MRKTIFTLLLMLMSMMAQAQTTPFDKYANTDGVTTVVVSKAMFQMMPNMSVGGHNIKKIASKIDQLKVLTCSRQSINKNIMRDAAQLYGNKPWQEVMRYKDGTNSTVIYMKQMGKRRTEYILYITDKGELELISIMGRITLQEIKDITR